MKIKILIAEHDSHDLELIENEIRKSKIQYELQCAYTESGFRDALRQFQPDIILSDFTFPSFDGPLALRLRNELAADTPFIFVSGTIGEEFSIEYLKNGVTDYALKDKLFTLGIKISRALREAEENRHKIKIGHDLLQSKKELERAQQLGRMGSWEVDLATDVSIWSDETCRLFGIPLWENRQTTESFLRFIHPDDVGNVAKIIKLSRETLRHSSFDHRIIRADGMVRFFHTERRYDFDDDGAPIGIHGICHDITDIKKAEIEIREMNAKALAVNHQLSTIINTLPANICVLDSTGKIIVVNESWKQFCVRNKSENSNYYLGDSYPDVCAEATAAGDIDACDMSMGITQVMNGALREYALEYPCHSPAEKRWFRMEARPLEQVDHPGIVVMHINITELKLAEYAVTQMNAELEEKVLHRTIELTDANIALEAFSYSVSHDLRSPITAIKSFAQIINEEYAANFDTELKELFGYIESSSTRMGKIIDDLLVLAKSGKDKLTPQPIDLSELFTSVWEDLLFSAPHHATLDMHDLPTVLADSSMLQQAVVNLLTNAIKYSSKKEHPNIQVGHRMEDERVVIYVKDNGAGFDMKFYDRLFGAFQRLHGWAEFEGTGVGLMLVKRIIERHGGEVWAEGVVDEGATFNFSLPLANSKL